MRAPVEFVVTRHLMTHPMDGPSQLARHCNLHRSSASKALKRLRELGIHGDARSLVHLRDLAETPAWRSFHFRAPDPDAWRRATTGRHWLTGEAAAARDGINLVPSRLEAYVAPGELEAALLATKDIFAKPCGPRDATLVLRTTDPWMYLDPDSELVERGQRLFDYTRSKNVQFARELERLG